MSPSVEFNHNCEACPLHKTACTVCVPGKGPMPAEIMIVGMNPGSLEDLRGEPFVGPAGEILNEALAVAGIDRDKVYVTNAAKCYGGKMKPSRSDLAVCTELYLKPEIEAVQPRVIIALGDLAMVALTNRGGVNRSRGQMFDLRPGLGGGIPVMVTYHPAAYLHAGRDKRIKDSITADFVAVREWLEGKVPTTMAGLRKLPTPPVDAEVLAFDVETNLKTGTLILGTIVTPEGYWPFGPEDAVELFRSLKARKLVAWNAKYDMKVLRAYGVDFSRFLIADPMLKLHILDTGRKGRYGLEPAVIDELGRADPEWLSSKREVHGGITIPRERLERYCAMDSTYTLQMDERLTKRLLEFPRLARLYKYLSLPVLQMLVRVEETPIPLDVGYLQQLDMEFQERIALLRRELAEVAGITTDEVPNFDSPKIVAKIMYETLGLPIVAVTKGGAPSTAKAALMELRKLSPFAAKMLEYRRAKKMHTGYVKRWLKGLLSKTAQDAEQIEEEEED